MAIAASATASGCDAAYGVIRAVEHAVLAEVLAGVLDKLFLSAAIVSVCKKYEKLLEVIVEKELRTIELIFRNS